VLSGRTNDEVKSDPDRLWRSDLPADRAAVPVRSTVDADELAALDRLGAGGDWAVFGRRLRVTELDRAVLPGLPGQPPVTRRDLLRYAAQAAPAALPRLAGRAVRLRRFPRGLDQPGNWLHRLPARAPEWLRPADPDSGSDSGLVLTEPAALLWAVQAGAVQWHAGTALLDPPAAAGREGRPAAPGRGARPQPAARPSEVLIELTAAADRWADLATVARLYRTALEHLGVAARPLLAGTGLQLRIPIRPGPDEPTVRDWAAGLAGSVAAVVPDLVGGRDAPVLVRNGGASVEAPAPYSPLAAPGAPVCTPVDWAELDSAEPAGDLFTVRSVPERLAGAGDPADPPAQRLPPLSGAPPSAPRPAGRRTVTRRRSSAR
jgi:bifunctional non-homologous end joining protein LigD